MRDEWLEHMESRCDCNEDGFDELEPEAIVMDRMQAALESAWEALRHTNAGEVAG